MFRYSMISVTYYYTCLISRLFDSQSVLAYRQVRDVVISTTFATSQMADLSMGNIQVLVYR